jgi:hypothetical protein
VAGPDVSECVGDVRIVKDHSTSISSSSPFIPPVTGSAGVFLDFLYARLCFVADLGPAISWILMIGSPFSGTEEKASGDSCVLRTSCVLMLENRSLKAPVKQVQWPRGRRHLLGLQGRLIARLTNSIGRAGAERDEFSCLPINAFTGHSPLYGSLISGRESPLA